MTDNQIKNDGSITTMRMTDEELRRMAREKRSTEPNCPYLLIIGGPLKHKKILLLATRTTIGRANSNNLVLNDPYVSSRHLVIERRPEGIFAEDLGSANGTKLNGHALDGRRRLEHEDRLEIGRTEMELRLTGGCEAEV